VNYGRPADYEELERLGVSVKGAIVIAPVAVPGLEGITQIAAGPMHNLELRRDGHVLAWGANGAGELGVGTRATGWTPAEVTGPDRVVAVAAGSGGSHGVSGAVRADGTFWCWGFGDYRVKGILAKNLNVPTLLDLR
jgi:alpha-tubulin suppressor-like RCC1 family protein